jgi:hypothetical protein
MVHRNNAGKLLLFPAPTSVPGSPAENWILRILEAKDNLVSALEFLRIAYNEMLGGRPVKSVDEVLARIEAILKNDAKVPAYTVLRRSGFGDRSAGTETKGPAVSRSLKQQFVVAMKKREDPIRTRSLTLPELLLSSVSQSKPSMAGALAGKHHL